MGYAYLPQQIPTAMPTNLALTLDSQVVEQAEAYARATGVSLDELIESLLKVNIQLTVKPRTFSPQVQELFGSLKVPDNFDYKESLTEAMLERHGK